MSKIKGIVTLLMVLMVFSVPALADVNVGAYRELFSSGYTTATAKADDGTYTATATATVDMDAGPTWESAWVYADTGAGATEGISYSWSESYAAGSSFLDIQGTDSLNAVSTGYAIVTNDESVTSGTSSTISMSLNVGHDSLWAGAGGIAGALAWADTEYGTWSYVGIGADVEAGTDDGTVYAYASGYSEDENIVSLSLEASVNVDGEVASAEFDGTSTAAANI